MTTEYNVWRLCDMCGHEGHCRPASQHETDVYDAEDVCQRCDGEDLRDKLIKDMGTLLVKIRDSGQWFYSALAMNQDVDGQDLLKEIEVVVGEKK